MPRALAALAALCSLLLLAGPASAHDSGWRQPQHHSYNSPPPSYWRQGPPAYWPQWHRPAPGHYRGRHYGWRRHHGQRFAGPEHHRGHHRGYYHRGQPSFVIVIR